MPEPRILQSGIVDVTFGERVTVIEPANLYGCTIGDDCFIGPFVEIQRRVTIGARTRVQSHAFICELVEVGSDCFISHGTMFINDVFAIGGPAHGQENLWKGTKIGQSRQHRHQRNRSPCGYLRQRRRGSRFGRHQRHNRTRNLRRQSSEAGKKSRLGLRNFYPRRTRSGTKELTGLQQK